MQSKQLNPDAKEWLPKIKESRVCWECNTAGHIRTKCPVILFNKAVKLANTQCWTCGKFGHRNWECSIKFCTYCKKSGHMKQQCFKLMNKQQS